MTERVEGARDRGWSPVMLSEAKHLDACGRPFASLKGDRGGGHLPFIVRQAHHERAKRKAAAARIQRLDSSLGHKYNFA